MQSLQTGVLGATRQRGLDNSSLVSTWARLKLKAALRDGEGALMWQERAANIRSQ